MDLDELRALQANKKAWLEWNSWYINMDFDTWIRWNCDPFLRSDVWSKILSSPDPEVAANYAEQQYLALLRMCDECLTKIRDPDECKNARATIFQNLQERFANSPMELVRMIVNCIQMEEDMKQMLSNPCHAIAIPDVEVQMEGPVSPDSTVPCPRPQRESLLLKISRLKSKSEHVGECLEHLSVAQLNYQTDMPNILGELGSTVSSTQDVINFQQAKQKLTDDVTKCRKDFMQALEESYEMIEDLFEPLIKEIASWKEKQKLAYLSLGDQPVEALKDLAKRCSDVGKVLFGVIKCMASAITLWETMLVQFSAEDEQVPRFQELLGMFRNKFAEVCNSSFIVTDQPCSILQVNSSKNNPGTSKTFPAKVRLLALESVPLPTYPKVQAKLESESELKGIVGTKSTSLELWNNSMEMQCKQVGVNRCVVADFVSFQVRKFKRPKRARKSSAAGVDQLFVCEQKFRLVFKATLTVDRFIQDVELKTMSLPLTITTNSSQESDCYASLLWQCWGTDVNNLDGPFSAPDSLPWHQVSDMLNKKMEVETGRALPDDQLKYLAEKLTGEECTDYSTLMITWAQFAKDKNEKQFTFWRWFHSMMNLVKHHMKEEWKDQRIYGFISKKNAEKILQGSAVGTFLLRISETTINETGPHITGSVAPVVVTTRKKASTQKIVKCAHHIKPYTVEDLKRHENLGNALGSTSMEDSTDCPLKYLYISPGTTIPREEAFKHYRPSQEGAGAAEEDGYSHYIGRTIHYKLVWWNYRQHESEDEAEEEEEEEEGDKDSGAWSNGESATPQSEMSVTSPFQEPDSHNYSSADHCYSTSPLVSSSMSHNPRLIALLMQQCTTSAGSPGTVSINKASSGSKVPVNPISPLTDTISSYQLLNLNTNAIIPGSDTSTPTCTSPTIDPQSAASPASQSSCSPASAYGEASQANFQPLMMIDPSTINPSISPDSGMEHSGNLPFITVMDTRLGCHGDELNLDDLSQLDFTHPGLQCLDEIRLNDYQVDGDPSDVMNFAYDEGREKFV